MNEPVPHRAPGLAAAAATFGKKPLHRDTKRNLTRQPLLDDPQPDRGGSVIGIEKPT
ncbi:MAG: hypothetical protein WA888_04375 [Burkholderiaceae bacterium]